MYYWLRKSYISTKSRRGVSVVLCGVPVIRTSGSPDPDHGVSLISQGFLRCLQKFHQGVYKRHWYINSTTIKNQHTTKKIYWHIVVRTSGRKWNQCIGGTVGVRDESDNAWPRDPASKELDVPQGSIWGWSCDHVWPVERRTKKFDRVKRWSRRRRGKARPLDFRNFQPQTRIIREI